MSTLFGFSDLKNNKVSFFPKVSVITGYAFFGEEEEWRNVFKALYRILLGRV